MKMKMERLIDFSLPLKSFAAMIFAGFMCLYMAAGFLYAAITGNPFEYAIPFAFVIQGAVLSLLISCLWGLFLSEAVIQKRRYFSRIVMFALSLAALLSAYSLAFLAMPAKWADLWLISTGGVGAFVVVLAVISEMYFRATGKRYTKILESYKATMD